MATESKGPGQTIQSAAGFVMIANRVLEAVLGAPLSGTQIRILLALIRITYGWRKISVKVTVSDLARFAGIGIGHDVTRPGGTFRKELASLIREGVVLAPDATRGVKTVTLGIQPDPDKWGRYSVPEPRLKAVWDVRHVHNDALIREAHAESGTRSEGTQEGGNSTETNGETKGEDVAQSEANAIPPDMAQSEATSDERWPDSGPRVARHRANGGPIPGHVDAVTPINSNELQGWKDSEIQRNTSTTTTTADDTEKKYDLKTPSPEAVYTLGITTAANRAITEKWGEQLHPLYYGASSQLASELMAESIPLAVAQSSILAQTRASKNPTPPSSINYFRNGIVQAAKSDEQRALDRKAGPVAEGVDGRGGSPKSVAYVIAPNSDRAEYETDRHYQAERDRAADTWAADGSNALQLAAILAKAESDNSTLRGTKFGDKAIARDVKIACGIAAGFPSLDVWKAARNPVVPRGTVENPVDGVDNS